MTSPSLSVSNGISCAHDFIRIGMPPIIVGQNSAQAIMSPLVSASAQVKSKPSLKIVEYDVFISRMPISRQIDTMVESRMFMVTMSTAEYSSGLGQRQADILSAGVTQRRPLHAPIRAEDLRLAVALGFDAAVV